MKPNSSTYFTIPADAFKNFRSLARRVRKGASDTAPILACVHFEALPHSVILRATDLDVEVCQTIAGPYDTNRPGKVAIPLAALAALKPDPATPVRFDVIEDDVEIQIVVKGSLQTFNFTIEDPAQFPEPPTLFPGWTLVSSQTSTEILSAIAASIPFQSVDQTRYVLNGTYLTPEDGGSVLATDGRRLIRLRTWATPVACILPAKLTHLLASLIPHGPHRGTLAVASADDRYPRSCTFEFENGLTIHSRLIEGNYPNYRAVIPDPGPHAITFGNVNGVLAFLQNLPSHEGQEAVSIQFRPPHTIRLKHRHAAADFVAHVVGEPPVCAYNPRMLASCLSTIGGTLHIIDEMSPAIFRFGPNLAVIMPMRVSA